MRRLSDYGTVEDAGWGVRHVTWNSGGGCLVKLIELPVGFLSIDPASIAIWRSFEHWEVCSSEGAWEPIATVSLEDL